MVTTSSKSFQILYRLIEKQFSLIPTGRGQMATPKSKYLQNIYNPPQEKLQNKKAATYFGQQKQAWKKKSFRAHILF